MGGREEIHGAGFPRVAIHLARYIFAYTHARTYSVQEGRGAPLSGRWGMRAMAHTLVNIHTSHEARRGTLSRETRIKYR